MRKITAISLALAFALLGCDEVEMNKQKLKSLKAKKVKLEKQIKELEDELPDSTAKTAEIPVKVKKMAGEKFNHYILAYGEVEAENYANISPEMPGRIQKIHVQEGQRAKKGELLVSLNTEAIDNSIAQIETNLEFVSQNYQKQKNLWEQKIGSEMQYLQAKNSKESLESQLKSLQAQKKMAQIRAPFDGIVDKIFGKEGELAGQMMPVLEFVNLTKLSITADISEAYIGNVKKGQIVEISFSSIPDLVIPAPIQRVSKVLSKNSRTFEIELKLDNKSESIKPFMVSTIKINDFSTNNAFVVPSLIIKQDITGKYLYTAKQDGDAFIATKTYITTGLSYDDKTMVESGLKTGDNVITDGFNLISSGIAIQIKGV